MNGKKYISSDFSDGNTLEEGINTREIKGRLSFVRQPLLTPFRAMLSRFFILILGWNENLGCLAKKFLKNKYIYNRRKPDFKFKRSIIFSDYSLTIIDTLPSLPKKRIKRIVLGFKGVYTYVPSADFFQISEMDSLPSIVEPHDIYKNKSGYVNIKRTYDSEGRLKDYAIE